MSPESNRSPSRGCTKSLLILDSNYLLTYVKLESCSKIRLLNVSGSGLALQISANKWLKKIDLPRYSFIKCNCAELNILPSLTSLSVLE